MNTIYPGRVQQKIKESYKLRSKTPEGLKQKNLIEIKNKFYNIIQDS